MVTTGTKRYQTWRTPALRASRRHNDTTTQRHDTISIQTSRVVEPSCSSCEPKALPSGLARSDPFLGTNHFPYPFNRDFDDVIERRLLRLYPAGNFERVVAAADHV